MSLTANKTPLSTIGSTGGSPVQSSWNAVHNPILFQFKRIDFAIDEIVITAGLELNPKIYPLGLPDDRYDAIVAGDYVYVSNSYLTGVFKVLTINPTYLIIEVPEGYVAGTYADGYLNLNSTLKNYYVECKIGLFSGATFVPFITTKWAPLPDGIINIEPSSWLKRKIEILNDFDYDQSGGDYAHADTNLGKSFSMEYREVWDDIGTPQSFTSVGTYYFTNAAKQIGDKYGGNMGEYVPYDVDLPDVQLMKFLTKFEVPKYWNSYPFDIGFIWSELLDDIRVEYEELDINSNVLASSDTLLDSANKKNVNRLLIQKEPSDQDTIYYNINLIKA